MSFLIKTQLNEAPINPTTQTNSPAWCLERMVPGWVIQIDTGYFLDKPCSTWPSYLEGHYYFCYEQRPATQLRWTLCKYLSLCRFNAIKGALWKQKKKNEHPWLFTMDQQLLPFWMDFDELRKNMLALKITCQVKQGLYF